MIEILVAGQNRHRVRCDLCKDEVPAVAGFSPADSFILMEICPQCLREALEQLERQLKATHDYQ